MKNRFILFCFLYLFQAACLYEEDIPMDNKLRCKEDGFCISNQSGRWLQGGYRKGEFEIEFDVVHMPDWIVTMNGGTPYAGRLVFGLRHQFARSAAAGYPDSWNYEVRDSDYIHVYQKEKISLIEEMQEKLPDYPIPKGFELHWTKLRNLVNLAAERRPGPPREDNPNVEARILPPHYFKHAKIQENLNPIEKQTGFFYIEQSPPVISQDDGNHSHGNPGVLTLYMGPFKEGAHNPIKSHKVEREGYEFKQEIALWSNPILKFFWWGEESDKDHTSSKTYIFKRLIGSGEKWEPENVFESGNHGSLPSENKGLREYAYCNDFPVTKNYYAAGGECDGFWGLGHVCNDDTAYQVWHAYGNWNGGSWCRHNYRMTKPSCEEPWEKEFK